MNHPSPWIPTRSGRTRRIYGLRGLLLDAHRIEDLALPVPPAASALLRLLVTIAARILGLDDAEMSAQEWVQARNAHLGTGRFAPCAVHAYFDRYIFDLFHPTRPFLQDPALARQCPHPSGVNKLIFGRPVGHNLAWLSAHHDTDPQPAPSDQAFWHLLIHHYYGAAGGCTPRTLATDSSHTATAGPLRSSVSFHPLGRTLFETLLAGMPKYTGDLAPADRCPWELAAVPDPQAPPRPVTWPGTLLTGRSRHSLLLLPAPDGRHVTDAYLTWAHSHPATLAATDPYVIIDIDPQKPIGQRRMVRRADADRAWWRDLDGLLLAADESQTVQRPAVFDTLNDLPPALRATLRVRVHGFDQDGKTLDRVWYTTLTPPLLPWTQETDPALAAHIAACRNAAEHTATRLTREAAVAWRATTTPPTAVARRKLDTTCTWARRARALYWPRAEATFNRLLQDPQTATEDVQAAFAADAVHSLRTAAAPSLMQHTQAAEAIALAIDHLRRRARPKKRV